MDVTWERSRGRDAQHTKVVRCCGQLRTQLGYFVKIFLVVVEVSYSLANQLSAG